MNDVKNVVTTIMMIARLVVIIVTIVSALYARILKTFGPMKVVMAPGVEALLDGTNGIKVIKKMMLVVSQEPVHSGSGIQIKLA